MCILIMFVCVLIVCVTEVWSLHHILYNYRYNESCTKHTVTPLRVMELNK